MLLRQEWRSSMDTELLVIVWMLGFGVLVFNVILFFKIWVMTENVDKITKMMEERWANKE